MDLKSKLKLYKTTESKQPELPKHDNSTGLLGEIVENLHGKFLVTEERYPETWLYGGYQLGNLDNSSIQGILPLFKDANSFSNKDILFLDTETTGLSGGVGTVAFLVGVGFFQNTEFVVRQYFMRDYDEESPLLWELIELISKFSVLVTFNGKAFDWNLLLSRFAFNKFSHYKKDCLHIDLLYPSRRIWKLKLLSCRLQNLEREVMSEYRVDDIPGDQIPHIYFQYVDSRDASMIPKVLEHNRLDILSMVSLFTHISKRLQFPLKETDLGYELLGVGAIYESCGMFKESLDCYKACTNNNDSKIKDRATLLAAKLLKGQKEYNLFENHCTKFIPESKDSRLYMLIEMSKHFEHREKDFEAALEFAADAMNFMIEKGIEEGKEIEELEKRIARLRKKIGIAITFL